MLLDWLLAGLLLTTQTAFQEKPPQEKTEPDKGFRIGVQVNQVFLSVNARSYQGGFVRDLTRDDFAIFEDGVEQEIVNFSSGTTPARVVLLIDASGSTRFSQRAIQRAAYRFSESLAEDDRVAIITFNSQSRLILDWTNDLQKVDTKLKSIWAKGRTVLNDALFVTYDDMLEDVPGKKAVILLTDGVDFGSLVTYQDVINLAERSEATVYTVSLLNEYRALAARERLKLRAQLRPVPPQLQEDYIVRSKRFLERLSKSTGGRIFDASSVSVLTEIYEEVAEEIKNQYYISYVPTNGRKDGTWRSVKILTARADVVARTRPGYYASGGQNQSAPLDP